MGGYFFIFSYESTFRCEFSAFYGIKNGRNVIKQQFSRVRWVFPGFGFSLIFSYIKISKKISQKPIYFSENAFLMGFSCLISNIYGKYY